jgi:hypothetical protein
MSNDYAPALLECQECGCVSDERRGWIGERVEHIDDPNAEPEVIFYCPPCAEREFDITPRVISYT